MLKGGGGDDGVAGGEVEHAVIDRLIGEPDVISNPPTVTTGLAFQLHGFSRGRRERGIEVPSVDQWNGILAVIRTRQAAEIRTG